MTATNLLGVASGAILDTATGTINTWGSRNEVQTGLTIGSDYYVQRRWHDNHNQHFSCTAYWHSH